MSNLTWLWSDFLCKYNILCVKKKTKCIVFSAINRNNRESGFSFWLYCVEMVDIMIFSEGNVKILWRKCNE